jgi:O-acetyl-ADP-ribose deacetylase (regulator of RNase III)
VEQTVSVRVFEGVTVECVQGDIARQPGIDAIVNAANAQLLPGAGVAGAIHRAAGPALAEECQPLAPITPGEAVITGAHHLPNRHVIHCLGPVFGRDDPSDALLASCYRGALRLAEEYRLTSIACPAISTGVFGYPMEAAARVALGTIRTAAGSLESVKLVRFVLHGKADLDVHEAVLAELAGDRSRPAAAHGR